MKESKTATIAIRVTEEDKEEIFHYIECFTEMKVSQFVREAIDEKIYRNEKMRERIRRVEGLEVGVN